MAEEKKENEKVDEVKGAEAPKEGETVAETPKKKKSNRTSTHQLLKSEVSNERFAGFMRLISDLLRRDIKTKDVVNGVETINEQGEADSKKISRITASIVKGIKEAPKDAHEPYKEEIRGIAADLYKVDSKDRKGTLTVEMQDFYTKMSETFKGSTTSRAVDALPEKAEDLGLF